MPLMGWMYLDPPLPTQQRSLSRGDVVPFFAAGGQ
jgi:hypothetical protein